MASSSGNYSPNDYIYIVCKQSVYIKQLRTSGPINTPLKVRMSTAYSIVCSGIKIHQYDPVTKRYALMTIKNAFKKNKFDTAAATTAVGASTMSLRTPSFEKSSNTDDTDTGSQELTQNTAPVQNEEPEVEQKEETPVEASNEEKTEEATEVTAPVQNEEPENETSEDNNEEDEQEEETPAEEPEKEEEVKKTTTSGSSKKKKKKKSSTAQKTEQVVTEG